VKALISLLLPSLSEFVSLRQTEFQALFERIYRDNVEYVTNRILKYLPPDSMAEDARSLANTFFVTEGERVIRRFDPEKGELEHLFNRSLTFFCIREGKRAWKRFGREVPVDFGDPSMQLSADQDCAREAEAEARRSEMCDEVQDCLGRMKEKYRRVIELRFVDELSEHDIAALLNITDVNCRIRIYRALQLLRECLIRKGIKENPLKRKGVPKKVF
jgi:RNA polymerase sigma factor (sigma-70 family)